MKTGLLNISILFIAAQLAAGLAQAARRPGDTSGGISFPKIHRGMPAVDLLYQGRAIDPNEAAVLPVDLLSRLDPNPTDYWKNETLSLSDEDQWNYPAENSEFKVSSYYLASKDMFRAIVVDVGSCKKFRLALSMRSHSALMEAGLLRKMGFTVQSPKRYDKITLDFPTIKDREDFIGELDLRLEASSRSRWIVEEPDNSTKLVLQDVILEPADIANAPPYYWGVLAKTPKYDDIKDHRPQRSLILPFVLMDVPERENLFSWELGRIVDNSVFFPRYLYSAPFDGDSTYEDLRWLARKMAKLSRTEWEQIVALGHYPKDVADIIIEKLISRRNHMVELFELASDLPKDAVKLPFTTSVNNKSAENGQLHVARFPGDAHVFVQKDPLAPLRAPELARFGLIAGLNAGIQAAVNKINTLITVRSIDDIAKKHQTDAMNRFINHIMNNPFQPYSMPTQTFGGPFGGFSVGASRNVITGTYYGSEAQVQLVDSITASANVGGFLGIDPIPYKISPGFVASVGFQRSYVHVRPIVTTDKNPNRMENALKYNWLNINALGFMKDLGHLVDPDYVDPDEKKSSSEDSNSGGSTSDSSSEEKKFPDLKWDPIVANSCPSSGSFGLDSGSDTNVSSKDDSTEKEKDDAKSAQDDQDKKYEKALKRFLNQLNENEMFIVVDAWTVSAGPQVSIPVAAFLLANPVSYNTSISLSGQGQFLITSRTTFIRTKTGIQVYKQEMNVKGLQAEADFNWWMTLLRLIHQEKPIASGHTLAYFADGGKDGEPSDDDTRKKWVLSMKSLFLESDDSLMAKYFPPYTLDHKTEMDLYRGRFLVWTGYNLSERHRVEVKPPPPDPNEPTKQYDPEKEKRIFANSRSVELFGRDFMTAIWDVVTGFFPSYQPPSTSSYGMNPSNTPFGYAHWKSYQTEAELTPGKETDPTTVFEEHWAGWWLFKSTLFKTLDEIENKTKESNLGLRLIRREEFASSPHLEMFDIHTTLIVYPEAIQRMIQVMASPYAKPILLCLEDKFREFSIDLKGPSHGVFVLPNDKVPADLTCGLEIPNNPKFTYLDLGSGRDLDIMYSGWIKDLLKMKKTFPDPKSSTFREDRIEWTNEMVSLVLKNLTFDQFVKLAGKDNIYYELVVNGFKPKDENGDSETVGDSIGSYNPKRQVSVLQDFSQKTGIMWNELTARYFTDGF